MFKTIGRPVCGVHGWVDRLGGPYSYGLCFSEGAVDCFYTPGSTRLEDPVNLKQDVPL